LCAVLWIAAGCGLDNRGLSGGGGAGGHAAAGHGGSRAGSGGAAGDGAGGVSGNGGASSLAGAGGDVAGAGGSAAGGGGSAAGAGGGAAGAAGDVAGAGGGSAGAGGSAAGAGGSVAGAGGSAAGAGGSAAGSGGSAAGAGGSVAGAGGSGNAGGTVVCIPPAVGVPGQAGLPDWWGGNAPFDDPRWAGSFAFGFANATFSALLDDKAQTPAVVLRWHVATDLGVPRPGDAVWVGLLNTTTGTATILRLTRDAAKDTTAGKAGSAMTVTAFQRIAPTAPWTSVAVPQRISADARVDVACDETAFPVVCPSWTIRARVPMASTVGGIDLDRSFLMWSEIDVENGDDKTMILDRWPTGAAAVDQTTDPPGFPDPRGSAAPASAAWLAVSTAGGTCTPAISLQSGDLSITNQIGTGAIIDVTGLNTFHLRPLNSTPTAVGATAIKASLRIADWHNGIGDAPLWLPVPDATCMAATGAAGGMVASGTRFDLTCTWTPSSVQTCTYRPDYSPGCQPSNIGFRYFQQAIFVELGSAGTPITFSSGSAAAIFTFSGS
jgi:hypothetical protein